MTQRKTSSLAYSEYVSPDSDRSIQVWLARLRVVDASRRVYPQFLNQLRSQVLPLYGPLAEGGYKFDSILWGRFKASPYELLTEDGGLKSALRKWAAKHHAECGWLLDGALRTLQLWYAAPEARESLQWNTLHGHSDLPATGAAFEFRCQGWPTQVLTWAAYLKSVGQQFKEKLAEYENNTRQLAESRGLLLARRQHSPANLEWFVLYQFAGMSSKRIADDCARHGKVIADSAVLKGIKVAARLIAWNHLRSRGQVRDRKTR